MVADLPSVPAAAFLIEVPIEGRAGPLPTPRSASSASLAFEAAETRAVTCGAQGVRVQVWCNQSNLMDGQLFYEDPLTHALTAVVGHLLLPAELAGAQRRWAAHISALTQRADPLGVREDLRGMYAALHLDASGDGWVMADPLGLRLVYWGQDAERVIIGSRAELVAGALAGQHRPVRREVEGLGWLAYTSYHVGDSTGFEGVRVVAPGAVLRIGQGGVQHLQRSVLVASSDGGPPPDVSVLADEVIDDVTTSLRAALAESATRHVINLTGGKDSRLLLAIALHAGLAHRFSYETTGFAGLADADLARVLARHFRLDHQVVFGGWSTAPFPERATRFVQTTAGMVNAWDLDGARGHGELRITGIGGEPLRSFVRLPGKRDPAAEVASRFAAKRFGRLGLLQPDVAARLHEELLARLESEPSNTADVRMRCYAHYAHHRVRFLRTGPREEIPGDRREQPLYSPVTLRAALKLPYEDLQAELLFAEILGRVDPVLAQIPFAGSTWQPRALAHLEGLGVRGIGVVPEPVDTSRAAPRSDAGPSAKAEPTRGAVPQDAVPASGGAADITETRAAAKPLMARLYANAPAERLQWLHDIFSDRGSGAWGVLDQGAALSAADRYSSLGTVEQRELYGAATAVLWMAETG